MSSLKIFFLLAALLVFASNVFASLSEEESYVDDENQVQRTKLTSLGGIKNRFLAQKEAKTCDKNPWICRAKGSPGPDCCKKKCVDVETDKANCGKCGKKCTYPEICCKGKCVNTMFDEKHCGGCNVKCKKGSSCSYGMCSYA